MIAKLDYADDFEDLDFRVFGANIQIPIIAINEEMLIHEPISAERDVSSLRTSLCFPSGTVSVSLPRLSGAVGTGVPSTVAFHVGQ